MRFLRDHPASVSETYGQHLRFAARFGATMIGGGLACLVHGLLPFCFTTTASRRVRALHHVPSHHRPRHAEPVEAFYWSI